MAGAEMTGVAGGATTVTVVVLDLVGSSTEVAVMVTVPAEAGAVQAPVEALMLPALADQVRLLVAPPVAVALKMVLVLVVRVAAAGLREPTTTVWGLTATLVAAGVPAALVTVRMKVLAEVMAPLLTATPLVTAPTPLLMLPVPLLKVGVRRVVPPKRVGLVVATRLEATGRPTTVTVVVADLVGSSLEVAVTVTVAAEDGAVQTPPLVMLPPVVDQVMPLVMPPVALAINVVWVLTSRVGAAGLRAATATGWGFTVKVAVAVVPEALVTVRVKVLAAVMLPLPKAVPLATVPML